MGHRYLRRLKLSFLALPILLLVACNSSTFPKYVQLGDLRILTIKALADQSEVNPGTTAITLQPVVSDISGGGRTLTATVQTCADPGVSLGATPRCVTVDTTTTSTFSTSTLSTNGTFTGPTPTFTVDVPAAPTNYALATTTQKYNGMAYLVFYTLSASDGTSVTAFKRITVSSASKSVKNKNPVISSIFGNGVALSATNTFSTAILTLSLSLGLGAETFQYMTSDGNLTGATESLTTTWFYSDGSVQNSRTTDNSGNQWTPPSSHPSGRAAVLVIVTHDGREGEDFQKFEFN